jgi:hypothetical protein
VVPAFLKGAGVNGMLGSLGEYSGKQNVAERFVRAVKHLCQGCSPRGLVGLVVLKCGGQNL